MPENEIICRTEFEFEETINRLRGCPKLQVQYDPELKPQGICHIRYRSVQCNIGRKGGVQIHYDSFKDARRFVKLIHSMAYYPPGASTKWVKTKERFGRTYYMNKAARLEHWIEDLKKYEPLNLVKERVHAFLRTVDTCSLVHQIQESLKWAPFHTKADYDRLIHFVTPRMIEILKKKKGTQLHTPSPK